MSGEFLSRWSRRKLEVKRAEEIAPADAPEAGPDAAPGAEELSPGELSPEELAALPPVESLTAQSDISAFLRKGVPQALRNAALRRAWALDPEIRDYIGDARDYAYDWNVPGGVPGTGPLDAGTDLARMVEDVFGRPHEPETTEQAAPAAVADEAVGDPPTAVSLAPIDSATAQAPADEESIGGTPVIQSSSTGGQERPPATKKRHGGAKPA
jgi:hypothetical protein